MYSRAQGATAAGRTRWAYDSADAVALKYNLPASLLCARPFATSRDSARFTRLGTATSSQSAARHREITLTEVDPVLKPCLTCGAPSQATRCSAHTLPKTEAPGRPSRQARGYDAAWQRLSSQLRSAQPWCTMCGKSGTRLTVDHIVPRSLGGDNNRANLRVLCLDCHNRFGATRRRPRILG